MGALRRTQLRVNAAERPPDQQRPEQRELPDRRLQPSRVLEHHHHDPDRRGEQRGDDHTDVLDDAEVSGRLTASSGSVALAGTDLTWTGALPVGATATVNPSVVGRENSRQMNRPPGLSTRRASRRAWSTSATLRMPKLIE